MNSELVALISVGSVLVAITWYVSKLATRREVEDLRHRLKNFVHTVTNHAAENNFHALKDVRWKGLGNNGHYDKSSDI
jgi:hypothetical protein